MPKSRNTDTAIKVTIENVPIGLAPVITRKVSAAFDPDEGAYCDARDAKATAEAEACADSRRAELIDWVVRRSMALATWLVIFMLMAVTALMIIVPSMAAGIPALLSWVVFRFLRFTSEVIKQD